MKTLATCLTSKQDHMFDGKSRSFVGTWYQLVTACGISSLFDSSKYLSTLHEKQRTGQVADRNRVFIDKKCLGYLVILINM
jgi:hypothetical protein